MAIGPDSHDKQAAVLLICQSDNQAIVSLTILRYQFSDVIDAHFVTLALHLPDSNITANIPDLSDLTYHLAPKPHRCTAGSRQQPSAGHLPQFLKALWDRSLRPTL